MSYEFLDFVEDILDAMDLRQQYPDVPWRGMAGMRDRIIHGYDDVDLQIVWDVVKRDIPQIKPLVQKILADYAEQDSFSQI